MIFWTSHNVVHLMAGPGTSSGLFGRTATQQPSASALGNGSSLFGSGPSSAALASGGGLFGSSTGKAAGG